MKTEVRSISKKFMRTYLHYKIIYKGKALCLTTTEWIQRSVHKSTEILKYSCSHRKGFFIWPSRSPSHRRPPDRFRFGAFCKNTRMVDLASCNWSTSLTAWMAVEPDPRASILDKLPRKQAPCTAMQKSIREGPPTNCERVNLVRIPEAFTFDLYINIKASHLFLNRLVKTQRDKIKTATKFTSG